MANEILNIKKELIQWINHLDDFDVLNELMILKEKNEFIPMVSETQFEYNVKDDFEERWAKGISGEELLKKVYKHIDSLSWKEK